MAKQKKQPSQPDDTNETPEELARDAFTLALRQVRDEIRDIRSGKTKPKEPHTPTETIAYLAKQASGFAAELRKAESEERKRIGRIRHEEIIAALRGWPKDRRAALLREAMAIDAEGSVLG